MNKGPERTGWREFDPELIRTTATLLGLAEKFGLLGPAAIPSCSACAVAQTANDQIAAVRLFLFRAANMKFNLTI